MNSTNGAPYMFDYMNTVNGAITPSTIHVKDSNLTRYFAKYLLQKLMSVYEWKMPEAWSKDYFLYTLYCWGYLAVFNTDKYGVIPQQCGLYGWDIFYRPTHAIITNPLLTGILQPKIDKQCVILKVQPDYCSPMDIVNYYAGLMALSTETATVNLINSKLSYVAFAGDHGEAETMKKMFDDVYGGEPAIVIDKALKKKDGTSNWQLFNQNVGQNYIVGNILDDLRKWENKFLTDIGINNANTEKKERLVVSEVEANDQETKTLASLWLEQMQESCEKVRNMFGIELSVDWREDVSRETGEEVVPNEDKD